MTNFDTFGHDKAITEAREYLTEIVEMIDERVQLVYHSLGYFYNNTDSQTLRWGFEKRQDKLLSAKDSMHFYFLKLLTEIDKCIVLATDKNTYSEDQLIDSNIDCAADPQHTKLKEKCKDFLKESST